VSEQSEERAWVEGAKRGSRQAFEQLIAAHSTPAYRLAVQMVGVTDAEDVTQAAFIRAFTNIQRVDASRDFKPWLLGIVANEALNHLRSRRTRFLFWQRQRPPSIETAGPESEALARAEYRELWAALNRLNDGDRLVLALSYLNEMSEAETAEALGIKRGTVKSRKHNALRRLRTVIEREFPALRSEEMSTATEGGRR
jgi:RNA polymerase sigma-70 factor, ECF subfamily